MQVQYPEEFGSLDFEPWIYEMTRLQIEISRYVKFEARRNSFELSSSSTHRERSSGPNNHRTWGSSGGG